MEKQESVKVNDNIVPFKSLNTKLLDIQSKLKGEKDSTNNYGKYKYRNVEGILSELKPLLVAEKLTMTISDSIKEANGEVYIEARVVLECAENRDVNSYDGYPNNIVATAFAREPKSQAGMSASQMTGTASSYARKYALGALFLLSGEACPDYASDLDQKNKELEDSLKTIQGKDKDKDKDKDIKTIIIPKLGKVVKDVKKNDGENTIVPVEGKVLIDLDDVKINYLHLRQKKFFPNHPIFLKALEEVKDARELAEEVPM